MIISKLITITYVYPNPANKPTLYINKDTMYAVTKVIHAMVKGHFQLLVSCLIAPRDAKQGTYNKQNAMNEYADKGVNAS